VNAESEESPNLPEVSAKNPDECKIPASFEGQCTAPRKRCHVCSYYYGENWNVVVCPKCNTPRGRCKRPAVRGTDRCQDHPRNQVYPISELVASQTIHETMMRVSPRDGDPNTLQHLALVRLVRGLQKAEDDEQALELIEKYYSITLKAQKILRDRIVQIQYDYRTSGALQKMIKKIFETMQRAVNTHVKEEAAKRAILKEVKDAFVFQVDEFNMRIKDDIGVTKNGMIV